MEILIVVGIIGVVGVIAVPMFGNMMANLRVTGDARSLSNAVAVSKMRAASNFSRVRLYVDLTGREFHMQSWDKTANAGAGGWVTEGGSTYLSTGVTFSYGSVSTPPPHTQVTIGQASNCTTDDGDPIDDTACVMFNSRGVPVDSTFAPTGIDALYMTDGTAVYAVTVASTGMVRSWRTPPNATPTWALH